MTREDGADKRPASYVIFGSQQRRLREHANLKQQELAEEAGYSVDLIRKVERGDRKAQPEYVVRVDEVLGARGILIAASEELKRLTLWPDWFEKYAETEAAALRIDEYDTNVVPGLLQGEEYARAVLSQHYPMLDDAEVEARVSARLERREVLTRKPICMLSFVIEEWVLRRPIGGKSVMKAQLNELTECAQMRNVTLQVLPTSCEAHAGFDGPMTLLETSEGRRVVYVEGQAGGDWVTAPEEVRVQEGRYGIIRGQALSTDRSLGRITEIAGEL